VRTLSPKHHELRVTARGGHAVLAVLESWFPGWTARVDGDPAPIGLADYRFMAVASPPGERVVTLRYEAPGLDAGLWGTGVGIALAQGPPRRGIIG